MQNRATLLTFAACTSLLVACAAPEPSMTLEEAKAACAERIAKPVQTNVGVGISGGSGGKVSTGVGVSVGVDIGAVTNPQGTYNKCVKRNSGHDLTETLETENDIS